MLYPTPAGSGKLKHWENTPPLECVAFTLDGWIQAIVKSRVTNYCQQVHFFQENAGNIHTFSPQLRSGHL